MQYPHTLPVISASRLIKVGGEKGSPGCQRKYAAEYLYNLKQAETEALRRGSALHKMGELHQITGEIQDPESPIGVIYSAGAHHVVANENLAVEYCHWGECFDGTPFVAYLDGSTLLVDESGTILVQDLKTTSNPMYALVGSDEEPECNRLDRHPQALKYAWIMCTPHWFAEPMPAGQYGPVQAQWWDPGDRGVKAVRLRWIYFLTRGTPRSWVVEATLTRAQVMTARLKDIDPLVRTINDIHLWHERLPEGAGIEALDQLDRNPLSCKNKGVWCGLGERHLCNFEEIGTPVSDLIQLRVRQKTTAAERLAALKKGTALAKDTMTPQEQAAARLAALQSRMSGSATPTERPTAEQPTAEPPTAEPPTAEPPTTEQPTAEQPTAEQPTAGADKPKRSRGRPRKDGSPAQPSAPRPPPAPPVGPAINPPEVLQALAAAIAAPELAESDAKILDLVGQLGSLLPAGVSLTVTGRKP